MNIFVAIHCFLTLTLNVENSKISTVLEISLSLEYLNSKWFIIKSHRFYSISRLDLTAKFIR